MSLLRILRYPDPRLTKICRHPRICPRGPGAPAGGGFTVPLVLTQPDRPAGRGMKLQASPVKQLALPTALPWPSRAACAWMANTPKTRRKRQAALLAAQADVMVVAAYGLILPQWVLDLPRPGLPEHPRQPAAALARRGAHPPRHRGGRCRHRRDHHADGCRPGHGRHAAGRAPAHRPRPTPPPAARQSWPRWAAEMIVQALELAACGGLQPRAPACRGRDLRAQDRERHESLIDWSASATVIARRIRAFDPFPGASTTLAGRNHQGVEL
jgi:methionyl-tRNA formyltransferase